MLSEEEVKNLLDNEIELLCRLLKGGAYLEQAKLDYETSINAYCRVLCQPVPIIDKNGNLINQQLADVPMPQDGTGGRGFISDVLKARSAGGSYSMGEMTEHKVKKPTSEE